MALPSTSSMVRTSTIKQAGTTTAKTTSDSAPAQKTASTATSAQKTNVVSGGNSESKASNMTPAQRAARKSAKAKQRAQKKAGKLAKKAAKKLAKALKRQQRQTVKSD